MRLQAGTAPTRPSLLAQKKKENKNNYMESDDCGVNTEDHIETETEGTGSKPISKR